MDGIKENIKEFTDSVRRCISLHIDSVKLAAIEETSKMAGALLAFLVLLLPLFFAVAFLLLAITVSLVPLLGLVWSLVIMATLLILLSTVLYLLCRPFFTRVALRTLCRILFKERQENEE